MVFLTIPLPASYGHWAVLVCCDVLGHLHLLLWFCSCVVSVCIALGNCAVTAAWLILY